MLLQHNLPDIQTVPEEQSLFSLQGGAGARTQAIFADGLGTKPVRQEQTALWLATEHAALGPHEVSMQGFTHLFSLQDSEALQSSSEWQPNMHMLCRHM